MLALTMILAVATVSTPTWSRTVTDTEVASWNAYTGDELQMLIRAAWTEGEAAERGITVSQAEIDEEAETDLGSTRAQRAVPRRASACCERGSRTRPSRPPRRASRRTRSRPTSPPTRAWTPSSASVRVLETRSRARAEQALKAINRGLTWSSAARRYGRVRVRTIVKAPPLDGFEQRILKDGQGRDHPLRDVRLPDHEDHAAGAPPRSTSSARRRGRSCPRRRNGSAVAALEAELRAKWLPRTVCAPRGRDARRLREPPNRRVTPNRAPPRSTGPKSRTSADVRLAPLPGVPGLLWSLLSNQNAGSDARWRSTRSRCLMRWPWMVLRPRDHRGRA